VRSTLMYYQFVRPPVPSVAPMPPSSGWSLAETSRFDDTVNAILDSLPLATYSPPSSSSDDDESVGPKQACGGCSSSAAPGASVFKRARRGATKNTLRLRVGLDSKKSVSSSDDKKSVSSPVKPSYDGSSPEVNDKGVKGVDDDGKEVNDKEEEVSGDVNEDDDP